MTDDSKSFFNAWKAIFGIPEKRLFCTWHVDRSWRRSISRLITKKEIQVEAYKIIRSLLVETDEAAFDVMLKEALKMFDEKGEMKEFKRYFEQTPTVSEVKYEHIVTVSVEKEAHVDNLRATSTRTEISKEEFLKECMQVINKASPEQYNNVLTLLRNTFDSSHLFPEANQEIVSRTLNMEPPNKKIKPQRYVSTKKTSQKTSTTLRKPTQEECQSVSTSLVLTAKSV
ncbi:hypothetical protein TNCV_3516491 [Trichonephila clavipes]|nr:hypothetical protein TNCV_3516491 [Trichonephila clavipes]